MEILPSLIDRTPKFVYEPPPKLITGLEKERHYAIEEERWHTGYGGLNGFHYFALTQSKIKMGTSGTAKRPIYREADEAVTSFFLGCVQDNKNGLWISRREFGKSYWAAVFQAYCVMTHPSSIQTATSESVSKIFLYFQDKFLIAMSGIDDYLKPVEEKEGNTKSTMYRKYSQNIINDEGKTEVAYAQFFGVETSEKPKSPSNISGQRAKSIVIDEVGLHPRALETLNSADPVVIEGGKRTGTIILTGTIENKVKNENVKRLNQMWDNAESMDLNTYFTPYWHALHMNADGSSNEKTAHEWWEAEAEKKAKAKDPSVLQAFIKNNPRTIEEAFGLSTQGTLPPEVLAELNEQAQYIKNNKIQIRSGTLVSGGGDKVEFRVKSEREIKETGQGAIRIFEMPEEGIEYIAGTDPIPMDNVASEDGSQHVTIIYKPLTETIVAMYAERNLNSTVVIRNVVMLCDFYNRAKNMIENNAGGNLITGIRENKRHDLMCGQPRRMGIYIKPSANQIIYGYRKTGSEFANKLLYDLFVKYVLQFCRNIYFEEIIKDAADYIVGNTDYIDAFQAVLLYRGELTRKSSTIQTMTAKTVTRRYMEPDAKGVNQWVIKTFRVANEE